MRLFYRLCYLLTLACFRLAFAFKAWHSERIPQKGGLILAPNHASYLDPPLVGLGLRQREVHFMARSSLFSFPGFNWLIRKLNAHPVERGQGPRQDWDLYLNLLKSGAALLVFPEGTRTLNGELQRGKSGFGRLVYVSQAPVYPAYIKGSFAAWPKSGAFRFQPISVYFGPAVPLNDLLAQGGEKRTLRQISQRVMQAIAELKQEADGC